MGSHTLIDNQVRKILRWIRTLCVIKHAQHLGEQTSVADGITSGLCVYQCTLCGRLNIVASVQR